MHVSASKLDKTVAENGSQQLPSRERKHENFQGMTIALKSGVNKCLFCKKTSRAPLFTEIRQNLQR
ncbi:hypothetical protein MTBSS4_230029 [Magnetospirillum sp. SS-4]|nr:hypothetical protein MTBSS4_230029 [Magnetospirillum sp. SS-4]